MYSRPQKVNKVTLKGGYPTLALHSKYSQCSFNYILCAYLHLAGPGWGRDGATAFNCIGFPEGWGIESYYYTVVRGKLYCRDTVYCPTCIWRIVRPDLI